MTSFADLITERHPNTTIYQVDALHKFSSFLSLWYQIDIYKQKTLEIMKRHPDGVHIIGYSQGGVIARGVIQTINNHNVDTFISVVAPHMGLSGNINLPYFGSLLKFFLDDVYKLAYSSLGQRFSLANIWRETKHLDKYLASNKFLPYINNEVTHSCNRKFKKNLIKLNRIILIGLSDDNVLSPWFTSQFGSLDANDNKIDMHHQKIYLEDTLGLRTLDERGRITTITFSGIEHQMLQFSPKFVDTCVLPWLT
uniref:palmitoyl-CoA hydrolase n=2 Tax=Strigamia maritima TaxID=126957 RepID=T1JH30_STRMM